MRVDRSKQNPQVLVIAKTRELCNQIHAVYQKLVKGTGITLANFCFDESPAQINIALHSKVTDIMGKGRSKKHEFDLSSIRCIVIDEADEFFNAEKEMKPILDLSKADKIANRDPANKVQWVLFSATFGHEALQDVVMQNIKKIIQQANQIMLKTEKLKLNHIKQFHLRCEPKKKLDFIKEVFDTCEAAQSFIFVNNKDFAELIHKWLLQAGYKSYIMFSKMSKDERDETMAKFRRQEIKVLITTNLIARGIDVPEVDLVINFDVP